MNTQLKFPIEPFEFEATTAPYAVVNSQMPKEGLGFYCRMVPSRRWGLPDTIHTLIHIATHWYGAHPTGPRIIISDISKEGGGLLCFSNGKCHKSHQIGLDVDIRPMRKDGKDSYPAALSYNDPNYSLELTTELVDVIRNNGFLAVNTIAFLDKRIPNLSRWAGHDKHLHVRFCMPSHYKSLINLKSYWC
jgi:murein endopeptidase